MATRLEEITGVWAGERFRFGDTIIGTMFIPGSDDSHRESITVRGECPADDNDGLRSQLSYRLYGSWHNHPKYGRQFAFQTFVRSAPHGRSGIVRYLQGAPHVGMATATAIYETFGSDAVRILREQPDVAAAAVKTLNAEKATAAARWLNAEKRLEDCTIDLIDLLGKRGFPKTTAREAIQRWGNKAAQIIKRRPYALMALRGCGFAKCDQLYRDLGHNPNSLKRQAFAAWYTIARDTGGHTWLPVEVAVKGIRGFVERGAEQDEAALFLAKRGKLLAFRRNEKDELFVAEYGKAKSEATVARLVAEAMAELTPIHIGTVRTVTTALQRFAEFGRCARCHRKLTAATVAIVGDRPFGPECVKYVEGGGAAVHIPLQAWLESHPIIETRTESVAAGFDIIRYTNNWPEVSELPGLSDHQRDMLSAATVGRIGLFTGCPGTGKTYSVARLIAETIRRYGAESVAVAAPTGKAAVRLTQAMVANGVRLTAKTIHSLLGIANETGDGWRFKHNEGCPLPHKFIVVDESSMIDAGLMASLLSARATGTSILFVGDPNQLPPVGHGAPLRDLIASGVPCGELREIRRNSGTIVTACAGIRDGQRLLHDKEIDLEEVPPKNLKVVWEAKPAGQIAAMFRSIDAAREAGIDPVWGVQILAAVNARSPLSRKELNKILQRDLNKTGRRTGTNPFFVGDKIVNTKNGFFPLYDSDRQADVEVSEDGKTFVANGELAEVVSVEDNRTIARLDSPPRVIVIPRGQPSKSSAGESDEDEAIDTGCTWELGYALSCHKAQGCEWPVVVVMLDEYPGARMVCSREWIYTAISRAKVVCLLVGLEATAIGFCRRTALADRKTFLVEEIERSSSVHRVSLALHSLTSGTPNLQPANS